jgi:serine phosphatase RsbU (regulator of sigma subunit)
MRLGGFATCLCAELTTAGALSVANAGHLAPYRNGKEMEIDSGFPLGIAQEAAFTESSFELAGGDRLTLLSDGVVEARDKTGDLFGFDRVAAISTQSAEIIAKTAQTFGQEDDITVLTLTFAPAELSPA